MELKSQWKVMAGVALHPLLLGGNAMAASKPTDSQRPNIVFIEVDDLNYEYLGCFGNKLSQTPNVDKLATNGVRFSNAMAQGMMSGPSRNSLITGMYPHNMGFYYNGDMRALPKDVWTFPKALQDAGYFTSFVGKCHIRPFTKKKDKDGAMRFQMGFNYVRQTMGRTVLGGKGETESDANETNDWYMAYLAETGYLQKFMDEFKADKISTLPEDVYLDGFFTKTANEFISSYNDKKPLFMWVNYSVPHEPYDVAEEFHKPFMLKDMPGTTTASFIAPPLLIKKTKPVKSEDEAKELQAGFLSAISYMDRQVGRVIQALKDKGMYDNTIIVFFSDQGVMMGDHKLEHKGTLYRQITNPSLIVSYPKEFKKNVVVDSPVELIDLINTTLDVAKAPAKHINYTKTSNSLVPVLKGKASEVRKYAFAENDGYQVVTDGRYRYVKGADASLLFDDLKDPKNLKDISKENPKIVDRLSAEIDKWLKATGPVLPRKSM